MAIVHWHGPEKKGAYRLDPEGHVFGMWYRRYLVYDTYFICRMPDIAYVTALVKFNILSGKRTKKGSGLNTFKRRLNMKLKKRTRLIEVLKEITSRDAFDFKKEDLDLWLIASGLVDPLSQDPIIERGDKLLDEFGQRTLIAEYLPRNGLILVDIMSGRTFYPSFDHGTKLSTLLAICKRKFTLHVT